MYVPAYPTKTSELTNDSGFKTTDTTYSISTSAGKVKIVDNNGTESSANLDASGISFAGDVVNISSSFVQGAIEELDTLATTASENIDAAYDLANTAKTNAATAQDTADSAQKNLDLLKSFTGETSDIVGSYDVNGESVNLTIEVREKLTSAINYLLEQHGVVQGQLDVTNEEMTSNISDIETQLNSRLKFSSNGTTGQFAVSDGVGGITWLTVANGNEVAY